jgi:hypothetical protein
MPYDSVCFQKCLCASLPVSAYYTNFKQTTVSSDTVSDVRCICIEELGYWMAAYPVLFLEDSYLKYVGWSLFDKISEVRMKCVSVLLPLYERQDLNRRLELFTSKFKDRLVSMVTDRDIDVAVKSCQLITQIHW